MQAEGLAYAEPRALSRSNTPATDPSGNLRALTDAKAPWTHAQGSQLREAEVLSVVLAMTQMFPLSSPRSHLPHRTLRTT